MFDEYFTPPSIVVSLVQEAAASRAVVLAESSVSTSIDQDAPSKSVVDLTLFTWKVGYNLLLYQAKPTDKHLNAIKWIFQYLKGTINMGLWYSKDTASTDGIYPPLDSVVVLRYEKRSKSKNKRKVPTEMELVLEQIQQGTSYEVSVSAEGVEELKRKVKIKGE
nr:retrovirus-related Pol polyprotein from transposon TNT 1-94 [Tanacetum cinerariifolium]GEY61252.1 retrovirus-related Pol polyprotein from transposon TNT 1-94 [Tanacetum cinerariifolium]